MTGEPLPRQMVVVEVGTRRCALDLQHVREVISLGPVTPVPTAPSAVAGAVNVHGHVTAVIDLGLLLDGVPGAPREGDAAVLVELDDYTVVLYVDRVHEVAPVDIATAGALQFVDLPAALHRLSAQIAARSRDLSAFAALDSKP